MTVTSNRKVLTLCLAGFLLAVSGVPQHAYGQSWWSGSKDKASSENSVYVDQNTYKPRRTWTEYFFGQDEQVQTKRGIFNRVTPEKTVDAQISDTEPKTVEELKERAKKLRAPHEAVIMRVQAEDRKRLAEIDQIQRMTTMEMQAKSRRETDAQLKLERSISQQGQQSVPGQPGKGKEVIYVKPAVKTPGKVFQDYR